MVLFDSVYINDSGGKMLLEYLIEFLQQNNQIENLYFLIDTRLSFSTTTILNQEQFVCLEPSEKARKLFYSENGWRFSSVFCFANVPPPVRIKNKKVTILFHNTLLLNNVSAGFSILQQIKYLLKKKYIQFKNQPSYNWVVQTKSVANLLMEQLAIKEKNIFILPFFRPLKIADGNNQVATATPPDEIHLLYVASSAVHKNHVRLIEACKLAVVGAAFKLQLHLTLTDNAEPSLLALIKSVNTPGFKIVNHGSCTHQQIAALYQQHHFFIFPSLTESFGLPLVEAALSGCKVVASDLPFVSDVIIPSLMFNPLDVNCIAKTIRQCFEQQLPQTRLLVKNEIDNLLIKIQ